MFTGVSSVKGLFEDRLQTFAHFRVVEWLLGSERGFQERRKLKLKLPGVEKIGLKAAWNRKYWLRKVGKRVYSRRTAKETSYTVHETPKLERKRIEVIAYCAPIGLWGESREYPLQDRIITVSSPNIVHD